MKVRQVVFIAALMTAVVSVSPCAAQSALTLPEFVDAKTDDTSGQPAPVAPTPRHTGVKAIFKGLLEDFQHLPSKENVYWAAGGGAAALAVHPLDEKVSEQVTGNPTADNFFKPGRIIGSFPVVFGTSATIYAYGRIKDQPKVSHLGMDLLRAIGVSTTMVQTLKYTTRRMRPDGSTQNSFPSGHSADTFAVATAMQRHLGWKYAAPAYMFASYVAASRLPSNRHWLSDVVFGATVGVIAGRTVGSHERLHPFIPISPVSVPGGMALVYTREW